MLIPGDIWIHNSSLGPNLHLIHIYLDSNLFHYAFIHQCYNRFGVNRQTALHIVKEITILLLSSNQARTTLLIIYSLSPDGLHNRKKKYLEVNAKVSFFIKIFGCHKTTNSEAKIEIFFLAAEKTTDNFFINRVDHCLDRNLQFCLATFP